MATGAKDRLFLIVVGGAIVVSMTGWLYALGWGALNLMRLIEQGKPARGPGGIADITFLQQTAARPSVHF